MTGVNLSVSQWLQQHSQKPRENNRPAVTSTRLAMATPADGPASVFGIAYIGGSGMQSALDADREVDRLLKKTGATQQGTSAFSELVKQFARSPLSGLTSITHLALRQSGWDPGKPGAPDSKRDSLQYGLNISSAPFFTLTAATRAVSIGANDSAWNVTGLLSRALSLFVAGPATFVENAITVEGNQYLLALSVYVPDPAGARSVVMQQTIYAFQAVEWPSFAEQVAGVQVTCAAEWLTKMASPRQV